MGPVIYLNTLIAFPLPAVISVTLVERGPPLVTTKRSQSVHMVNDACPFINAWTRGVHRSAYPTHPAFYQITSVSPIRSTLPW